MLSEVRQQALSAGGRREPQAQLVDHFIPGDDVLLGHPQSGFFLFQLLRVEETEFKRRAGWFIDGAFDAVTVL